MRRVTLALSGPDCVRSPARRDRPEIDVVEHPGDDFDRGRRDRLLAQPRDARDDWVVRFTPAPIILVGLEPPQPISEQYSGSSQAPSARISAEAERVRGFV